MNKGWIKLHRQFLEWEWYDDPNTLRLFLHCLLKANHKDKKYRGDLIKRSTFVTSLEVLAFELNLSTQQIRTSLSKLEKTGEINRHSNRQGTVVTVCNYNTYQSEDSESNTQSNKRVTDEQQTSNKRATPSKEVKNERSKEDRKAQPKDAQEVEDYASSIDYQINGQSFIDYYETNGWMRGKNKIKCWKACVRTWKANDKQQVAAPQTRKPVDLVALARAEEAKRNG